MNSSFSEDDENLPFIVKRNDYSPFVLLKSLWIWFIGVIATLVWGTGAHIAMLFRNPNIVHLVAVHWGKVLIKLAMTNVVTSGQEKLHRDGPVILLCNHQSLFDIPVLYSILDIQFRWMAKASLFKLPIIGRSMREAGYIPVERDDRKKALKSLYDAADRIRSGTSVIVFPEGTRGNGDGSMREFKKGAFLLARKASVVLQPITICGANRIVRKQKGKWIQRVYPGKVLVVIHDPVSVEIYKEMNTDTLSEYIRKTIQSPLEQMRREVDASRLY